MDTLSHSAATATFAGGMSRRSALSRVGSGALAVGLSAALGPDLPADEAELRERADEARDSRLWAGIHFPIDNEMGATMGGAVGRLVADYARSDGAE